MSFQPKVVRAEGDLPSGSVKLFFTGTGALLKGMGLCYDVDATGSAGSGTDATTDAWAERCMKVQLPSTSNNNSFAGVVAQAYAANANGQWVEVILPGSFALLLTNDSNVTIGDSKYSWCIAGGTYAGYWTGYPTGTKGMMGKGCAKNMQTISAAGTFLAQLQEGPESGLVQIVATATLTTGGAITCTVGGSTFFDGAATIASDATFTMAAGDYIGQLKRFYCDGNMTTSNVVITVVAEGLDGTTDTTGLELDADLDDTCLIWTGSKWRVLGNLGTSLS